MTPSLRTSPLISKTSTQVKLDSDKWPLGQVGEKHYCVNENNQTKPHVSIGNNVSL